MAIDLKINTKAAGKRLSDAGLRLVRDSASVMQEGAQGRIPVDTGTSRRMIVLLPTPDGAEVVSGSRVSKFLEFGTGIFNEGGDGRKDGWVYFDERRQRFYYTRGMRPTPYMRESFAEAVRYFDVEKKRRGL